VGLGHGETDGIGETLAERASGDFDTGSVVGLRVTGCDAVDLLGECQWSIRRLCLHVTYTERLQVIDGDLVAEKMDQSILEHASVTVPVTSSQHGESYNN
jgi:hypothetical protein